MDKETGLPVSRPREGSALGCLATLAIVAVILLVAFAFAVRTRGACELLADYFRDRAGIDLAIGSARIALPYDLVLEDLRSRTNTVGPGALRIREVRLGFRWNGEMPVRIRGAQLELARDAAGAWQTACFERVGALTDIRETQKLFAGMPSNLRLEIRDSGIVWKGKDGAELAAAQGLDFRVLPLEAPGKTMGYYELFARSVKRLNGGEGKTVRRVWLSTDANPYVEIVYSGFWDNDKAEGNDWWSEPGPAAPRDDKGSLK